MKQKSEKDSIVAIATPPGSGAIGILRLSGPAVLEIVNQLWKGPAPQTWKVRHLYKGHLIDPKNGQLLDEVLAFFMKAPHSFTGEDVIEIHGHGGFELLEILLQKTLDAGARLAEPGEFTRRAFLNGRIDLTQAEAIQDLVEASNEEAAAIATAQLQGSLRKFIGTLREELLSLKAHIEAVIDFPEDEDVSSLPYPEIRKKTAEVHSQITELIQTYREGRYLRDGISVVLAGKPNVGKSSLLNALVQEERAIVHHNAGTTRDVIEAVLVLDGLKVRFMDTAGIREGSDAIEKEGIRRSLEKLATADLALALFDQSRPWDEEDARVFSQLPTDKTILVLNKHDLPPAPSWKSAHIPAIFNESENKTSLVPVSALTQEGVLTLKQKIKTRFFQNIRKQEMSSHLVLTNLRHRTVLEKSLIALEDLQKAVQEERGLELIAEDLTRLADILGDVTGEILHDEVLDRIFSRFCIGK